MRNDDMFEMNEKVFAFRGQAFGGIKAVPQKILGHEFIQVIMDKYVHVTDDSLRKGVQ